MDASLESIREQTAKRRTLLPAEQIVTELNDGLRGWANVNADLANRIEVVGGEGQPAAYYRYLPVRQLGGHDVVIPIRRSWLGFICVMVLVIMLPSASRQRGGSRLQNNVFPDPIEEARVEFAMRDGRSFPATGRRGANEIILRKAGVP